MNGLLGRIRLRLISDLPLVPVLTAVFAGVSIITFLAYDYTRHTVGGLAQARMIQNLVFLDYAVGVQVRDMTAQTKMISQEGVLRLALEDSYLGASARVAARRKLEGYVEDKVFERFYLMDKQGKIILASDPALVGSLNVSDRDYFLQASRGKPFLQTIAVSRVTSRPILVSSAPIHLEYGGLCGVLVGIRDTESLAKNLLDAARIGNTGIAYILDANGQVLGLPSTVDKDAFDSDMDATAKALRLEGSQVARYSRQGTQRLITAKQNMVTGWTLVMEADEAEVLAPVTRLAGVSIGVSFLTLALVAIALGALRRVLVNLRNSESNQRTLTELSPVGIVTFNQHGRPVYVNRQARSILELGPDSPLPAGIELEDADGNPFGGDEPFFSTVLPRKQTVFGMLAWLRPASGSRKALFINAAPLSGQGGAAHGFVATFEDTTERVRTQEALRVSEEKFRSMVESSPMGMHFYVLDPEDRLILSDANDASDRMLGVSHRDMFGLTMEEAFPQLVNTEIPELYRKVALGDVGRQQFEMNYRDERFSGTYDIIVFKSGHRSATTFYLDITERKKIEEERRKSEERFAKLFRLSPEAIMLLDLETRAIKDVNDAFCSLTGHTLEELVGKTTLDIGLYVDKSNRERFYAALLQDGFVENQEFEGRRKDGSSFIGSLSGQSIEIGDSYWLIAMIRDITEVKKMQEMMIQTEKMISVGGIAAGIAHEINNPLGIVLQAAQNIAQRTRADFQKNRDAAEKCGITMDQVVQYLKARKLDEFIHDIQAAAIRASGIIRHMLDFSRRSESKRTECHLPSIVEKAVSLAESDYDLKKSFDFKRITVTKQFEDNLPTIHCTETEIEQVLLNLLRNAAQALSPESPAVEKPRIDIRVSNQAGNVRIEVEDNGPGIPPEVQRRIFEPFFTTKAPGIGTGLGLSVSYFIVTKGHGGTMSVSSAPGQGAQFAITLPGEAGPEG